MKKLSVLVGCEESQEVTKAFRERGHEAYSCDLKPCSGGRPDWHIVEDIMKVIGGGLFTLQTGETVYIDKWDMGIFFPDCTYITVTANKWLKDQPARKSGALVGAERRAARQEAIEFFIKLATYEGIDKIAVENPIGCMSTEYRKPDQIIQPYQFGHKEQKKTCLWLKNLPLLVPTDVVEPEPYHVTKSGKTMPRWYAYADKSQGQAKRAEIRSKTFSGIANGMATQFSAFIESGLTVREWENTNISIKSNMFVKNNGKSKNGI